MRNLFGIYLIYSLLRKSNKDYDNLNRTMTIWIVKLSEKFLGLWQFGYLNG